MSQSRIQTPTNFSIRSFSPPAGNLKLKSSTRLISSKFLLPGQAMTLSRFTRKKSTFNESRRKISPKPLKVLPKPITSNEIRRLLMSKEERRMMDQLYNDEKKFRVELFQIMNLTLSSNTKSPKRKLMKE